MEVVEHPLVEQDDRYGAEQIQTHVEQRAARLTDVGEEGGRLTPLFAPIFRCDGELVMLR
jgi:hypothetical protein